MTMSDGRVDPRVSINVIDGFDDSWAASFTGMANDHVAPFADIVGIEPSPHALPADLATKAMHGEEWRMGAYRYAVVLRSGAVVTLMDGVAVWLPDTLTAGEIADVIPNPTDEYEPGGQIPREKGYYVSTPQTYEADRETYERHFEETASSDIGTSPSAALQAAPKYAEAFPLRDRPLAYAAMWDRMMTGVSRYERFMGDDIDLLARFAEREGHSRVPKDHVEAGRRLGLTGIAIAAAMQKLSDGDLRRLNAIPGWEAAVADAASKVIGFDQLRRDSRERDD